MSSDNASSAVTYTSISSDSNGLSWGIPLVNAGELPEMDPYEEVAQQGQAHPLSPAYVPDPIELDEHVPVEDQPYDDNASPTAELPGHIADSDSMKEDSIDYPDEPKDDDEDPEEDPEEDHTDYPVDGEDVDDEPSDDDDDDDTDDEDEEPTEDEEEEEHLAPADPSAVPVVDPVPSAGDTEAFEIDERFVYLPLPYIGLCDVAEVPVVCAAIRTTYEAEEPLKFFKKSWKTTGKDVCEAVREFFKTNKLLGEVNATLITLVPKIHNPNKVSDYRPIACCNVIYKCISKIITNRITGCLDKLISINQSAFVPGRIIQDNLLITQELLKGYNKKSGPARCALKIDIAKAYDTVDWKFLNDIMLNFGFHEKFVGWVMTCVSSAAFTICINGERYGYFKSGRGLRQGDPMSPYLFTLVMEVLTLMVNRRIERENHFKYHWGCKDIKLAQLCFADDLLMLCNGDHQSVKTLKDGLMEFSKSSGLIPNMNKSTIFFGSIKEDEKKRILD
ncbi:RNA-directed DNA polymerase, eukaryota, reverse transcriptase zinc-binding domain protein, partial [Tanacetum coccineum]